MDKLITDLMKDGMSINDIMDMPFNFLIDIMIEKSKPEEKKSLISAFGG